MPAKMPVTEVGTIGIDLGIKDFAQAALKGGDSHNWRHMSVPGKDI